MKINWKVRVKSLWFWLTLIPAVLLLAQVCAAPFGYEWDFAVLNQVAPRTGSDPRHRRRSGRHDDQGLG